MRRLIFLSLLLPAFALASNGPYEAPYGVEATFNFKLFNTDGTLDVDEADGGAEVEVACDEGAQGTATNDFVDEGDFYSIVLTATEMSCARIAVSIAATDKEVFFVRTTGYDPPRFQDVTDDTGSTTTTDLTAAASSTDDHYNNYILKVFDVSAGEWYEAIITDYVGSTQVATHTAIPAAAVSGDGVVVENRKSAVINVSAGRVESDAKLIEGSDATDQINAAADTALSDINLDQLVILSGTADSGTSTSFVDAALTEADSNYWAKNIAVLFTNGTIAGQSFCVSSFIPGTDTVNFTPAATQAVSTNTYIFIPAPGCDPFR